MTRLGFALLGVLFIACGAVAQTPDCAPDHKLAHGGYPHCTSWYARPSDTGRYIGYYVGGGCPFYRVGEDRHAWEGTWGWDYQGFCWPSRVVLDWYHGRRYQGGQGAYRTDGPRPIQHLKGE